MSLTPTVSQVESVEELGRLFAQGEVVVNFTGQWCGSCDLFGPVFARVAGEAATPGSAGTGLDQPGPRHFATVDVWQLPDVAAAYAVTTVPTVVVFREGRVAGRHDGVMTARVLRALLHEQQ